jgi:hypothetical protein
MIDQPQAPQALQTGGVTRFCKVLARHLGNPGLMGRHRPPSLPPPQQEDSASVIGYVQFYARACQ